MEKHGIEQLKEVQVALNEIILLIATIMKDGLQASDAIVIYEKLKANPELSAKLISAYNDIEKVPVELKDIDFLEGIELAKIQLSYLPHLAKVLAK